MLTVCSHPTGLAYRSSILTVSFTGLVRGLLGFFSNQSPKHMKYLLKIVLLSILLIPFSLVDMCKAVWLFDNKDLKALWFNYKRAVKSNYRAAFGIRRPSTF